MTPAVRALLAVVTPGVAVTLAVYVVLQLPIFSIARPPPEKPAEHLLSEMRAYWAEEVPRTRAEEGKRRELVARLSREEANAQQTLALATDEAMNSRTKPVTHATGEEGAAKSIWRKVEQMISPGASRDAEARAKEAAEALGKIERQLQEAQRELEAAQAKRQQAERDAEAVGRLANRASPDDMRALLEAVTRVQREAASRDKGSEWGPIYAAIISGMFTIAGTWLAHKLKSDSEEA